MGKLLLILFCISATVGTAQSSKIFFTEALDAHLPAYIQKAETAIANRQQEKVKTLFDQFVDDALTGTYMNDFQARKLGKKNVNFSDFEKPVMLLTYSSWCIPSKGELPALNELAKEYEDLVDIVLLFWDNNKTVKKITKDYHRNIEVIYVDETENRSTHIIRNLKHSLGLPLVFTLNSKKEIIDIKRRVANKMSGSTEDSFTTNHKMLKERITDLLFNEKVVSDVPIGAN